jgi:hypothetical protein
MKLDLNPTGIFNRYTKVIKHVLNRNRIFNRYTKVTKHGLNISVSSFLDSLESEVDARDVIVFLVGQIEKKIEKERKKEKKIYFERLDYKILPLYVIRLFNLETLITFSNCKTLTLQIAF